MLTFISLSRFVEKFKTRKTRTRRQRAQKFNLPMETLESRVLPAATIVGLPGGGTFLDADGDKVTVRVSGTTGTAKFTDAGGGTVGTGEDIAGVAITGASSDFTLTYSFDDSGAAAETVLMGDITSTRTIKGVFSVPLNNGGAPIGSFTLGELHWSRLLAAWRFECGRPCRSGCG